VPAPYAYDPELVPFADLIPRNPEPLDHSPAAAVAMRGYARTMLAMVGYDVQDHTGLSVEDRSVPGYQGAAEVPLRIYRSASLTAITPVIVWIHGGGFVQGSIFEGPSSAARSAQCLPLVCIDVQYRLAPEAPAPAAIEDCYAALLWVHANASALGVDQDRILVVGQSAGGGIAAGLSLMARDLGGPRIAFLGLIVPELDVLETVSMQEFTDTPMFCRSEARRSWDWYLGGEHDFHTSPFAVPGRREDLTGLPPTYVAVSQFDPLRDEGIAYASRLLQCGVVTELHCFPGTFHGSAVAAHAEVSLRESKELNTVLAKAAGVVPLG
jgi:acetyl esterase